MDAAEPSWKNVDGVVIALFGSSILVTTLTMDADKERPIMLFNSFLMISVFACRYVQAWWASELHPSGWLRHLTMANCSIIFWTCHLVYALWQGSILAPLAYRRLTEYGNLTLGTCGLAGFLMGAEPASGREKISCAVVLVVLVLCRILVLASWLPTRDAARDFSIRAFTGLVASPCLLASLGWVTRQRLSSAAAELAWLRSHAERLEVARQQSLIRGVTQERARAEEGGIDASNGERPQSPLDAHGPDPHRSAPGMRQRLQQPSMDPGQQEGRARGVPSGAASTTTCSSAGCELNGIMAPVDVASVNGPQPSTWTPKPSAVLAVIERPMSPPDGAVSKSRAREEALWQTLSSLGIQPRSETTGDAASSSGEDAIRPHGAAHMVL